MKKSTSSPKSSPASSTWAELVPRKVRLPALVVLAAMISLPWLLDLGEPTPPPKPVAARDAKSGQVNSPLSRLLSPSRDGSSRSTSPQAAPSRPLAKSDVGSPKGGSVPFLAMQSGAADAADASTDNSPDQEPGFERPLTAPNGAAWPEESDYVEGYEKEAQGGLSTVTIDNSRNADDVFLKLVALQGNQFQPVRFSFVKAFSQFVFSEVQAGQYDVRFRNLSTGELNASAPFILRETATSEGTRYSNYSLTLYNVANGNMKLKPIKDTQF